MHYYKCANAFSHVIETINKNNKQIVEGMDQILNLTQLQIEDCHIKIDMNQLKYFKERNKRIFKTNNMVIVLSDLKITMCDVFIYDAIVNFDIDSSKGDNVKLLLFQQN